MLFSTDAIAAACDGRVIVATSPDVHATDISWDSRSVHPGDLYLSIPGERVDGNDFVVDAISAGAVCALMTRMPTESETEAARSAKAGIVLCDDSSAAIVDLARAWRSHIEGCVIGITGSVGKTTTKNLVAAVLSKAGTVVATHGNQNNELGVPATILHANKDTNAVVVEMGMRGLGQIASMCAYVRPQMSLVSNVGTSHIELLGSRENIARAKAEILDALPQGGCAFLNASGDFSASMYDSSLAGRDVTCIWFDGSGEDPTRTKAGFDANVYASDIVFDEAGRATFTLHTPSGHARCAMRLPGSHNVQNACAAAAVGYAFDVPADRIAEALSSVIPMQGRDKVIRLDDGVTVVDDAYNANPDSMRASLSTFAKMDVEGRKVAVLGDMSELGDFASEGHRDVGACAAQAHVDMLVCVGPLSRDIARGAEEHGMDEAHVVCVDDADGALDELSRSSLSSGDAVLVKASHSTGLDRVVRGLVER